MNLYRSLTRSMSRAIQACSLALLALGLCTPSESQAAHCGSYVLFEARFERDLARLFTGDSSTDTGLPLPPPPSPCKGAFCSTPPATPLGAPSVPMTLDGEHWLCQMATLVIPPAQSFLMNPDNTDLHPVDRGLSVFHPPRRSTLSA